MNIKLHKLSISSFKGIKNFELNLACYGDNCVIKAENGIGKTTIYDAFLWLLFGKNSEGKKDFEARPLDKNNQPIKGLVVAVEADIDCAGTVHTFRKEHHEKLVKKQLRGYETLCTIDEVPKKISEYNDYIAELIAEDTFKLLTDLTHFNNKLHWTDRRKVLLDIAGEIGTPDGFDSLLDEINGRTVDEYKKILSCRKIAYEKERNEINPRINEIQKGFNGKDYVDKVDTKGADEERCKIKTEIAALDKKRKKLFEAEKQRQEKIEHLNNLKCKRTERIAELASDTSGIEDLLEEKKEAELYISQLQQDVFNASSAIGGKRGALRNDKAELESSMKRLSNVRTDYSEASEAPVDDTCYACKQKLPAEKIAELDDARKKHLVKTIKEGNEIKADVDVCKEAIAKYEAEIKEMQDRLDALEAKLQKARDKKDKRFAEIDEQIKFGKSKIKPSDDEVCKQIYNDIIDAQKSIGEPISEQMQQIDQSRTEKTDAIAQLDKALAHADRMKADKARIKELEQKEKDLAQKIADVEKQLADIDGYKADQSRMIEEAVNGKFKHVEFKLFNQLLNGGLEDACEATFGGVPYSDMSTGQKIYCGIDIVNVLSSHYGVSVPMFIDHSESFTLPIEAETQTIKLFAKSGIKELIVIKEGALANV